MTEKTGLTIDSSFLQRKNYKCNGAAWFLEDIANSNPHKPDLIKILDDSIDSGSNFAFEKFH